MNFIFWLIIGFLLGIAFEWYSWYKRLKKNNLFDERGNLYKKGKQEDGK